MKYLKIFENKSSIQVIEMETEIGHIIEKGFININGTNHKVAIHKEVEEKIDYIVNYSENNIENIYDDFIVDEIVAYIDRNAKSNMIVYLQLDFAKIIDSKILILEDDYYLFEVDEYTFLLIDGEDELKIVLDSIKEYLDSSNFKSYMIKKFK